MGSPLGTDGISELQFPESREGKRFSSRFYTDGTVSSEFSSPGLDVGNWSFHRFSLPKDPVLLLHVSPQESRRHIIPDSNNVQPTARSVPRQAATTVAPQRIDWLVGDKVRHTVLGEGTILEIKPGNSGEMLFIDFGNGVTKRFFPTEHRLSKIEPEE